MGGRVSRCVVCFRYRARIRTGVAESIDDSSKKFWADGDIDNLTGSLDSITLLDGSVGGEDGNTDLYVGKREE
jgi:hypothetical protein